MCQLRPNQMPVSRTKLLASNQAFCFLFDDYAMDNRHFATFVFPLADSALGYAKDCAEAFETRIKSLGRTINGMDLCHGESAKG